MVIDPETAPVVEEIYHLYLSGLSCKMIAVKLTERSVPTPSQVKRSRGEDMGRKECVCWSAGTIRKILKNPVYLGHMVQGKEEKISFKASERREAPRNRWFVVENTHKPIIKRHIFDEVGRIMVQKRRSPRRKET